MRVRVHLLLAAALFIASAAKAQSAPTFTKDVAPIVWSRCVSCHHPDGDAPFSLTTYADVRRRAAQIATVVKARYMPPWKPAPGSGDFIGTRRLSDTDIATITQWVDAGAVEGNVADLPPLPAMHGGWQLGQPDLIIPLPAYTLRAEGIDTFRNFVLPVPTSARRYVRAFEFRPGNRAVHHANIRVDRTRASRALDEADPDPGYEGLILHSADYPDGHFLGWTPGQAAPIASPDLSWTLEPNSDLVIQLHMQPTGKPETVRAAIGLYFTDRAPARVPTMIRLGRQNLNIPAGAADFVETDSFVLPTAVEVHAVQPHSHYRARTVEATATLPDGSTRSLIRIDDWDFRWQDQYRYREPFWLPAGTRIDMRTTFDNSGANPRNPDRIPQRVSWGWRSSDEMGDVWLQVFSRTPADRDRLMRDVRRKTAAEDAIGGETLIARDPNYVSLRNDTALAYLELGQADAALRHFAVVTALQPSSAAAHYNEGVALEAAGRRVEALAKYRRAIALDPNYSPAHNNVGSIYASAGRLAEAIAAFRRAVETDRSNAEARNNLGGLLVGSATNEAIEHLRQALSTRPDYLEAHFNLGRALATAGDARGAIREYAAALGLQADWSPALINLAWLLSAHADRSIRNPQEAVRLAERAVVLTPEDPAALDVLAAALAASGQFDNAVTAATKAQALARDNAALADDISRRLVLYRSRRPFIVDP
jgi:tetratricopeptide (TPR) repeat protein